MNDAPDVIVVDDEEELRHVIARYLGRHGIQAREAADAAMLDRLVAERRPDIVLLDVVMPGEDGVSVARRLRAADPAIGLVMLTAASDVIDRVVGLEVGADDYIAKPFDLRELLARIRSLHRRLGTTPAAAGTPQDSSAAGRIADGLPFGPFTVDRAHRRLFDAEGGEVPLTSAQFDLLRVFAERPGRLLTREQLLSLAPASDNPFDRAIDVRVARLRRKLAAVPGGAGLIRTIRGTGYQFDPASTAGAGAAGTDAAGDDC